MSIIFHIRNVAQMEQAALLKCLTYSTVALDEQYTTPATQLAVTQSINHSSGLLPLTAVIRHLSILVLDNSDGSSAHTVRTVSDGSLSGLSPLKERPGRYSQ